MQMHASLKLAMRSSEITRSSSKRDVVVNTTERSSNRTWQTRHPCGGQKKIFPEKSVNRGFLFSFGESGLIDTCQTMARDFSQAGQT